MEEMSQLGFVGSGNKLQRPKRGPWSLGNTKAERMCLRGGNWDRGKARGRGGAAERQSRPWGSREWEKMWACSRERRAC